MTDLNAVLDRFFIYPKTLSTPERLERVAFEAAEDCFNEGLEEVELRFSPGFVSAHGGLQWNEILDSFERGLKRAQITYPKLRAGLICIASRDQGMDAVGASVEFFIKHQARFLGFDLAGPEGGFECQRYAKIFAPLRRVNANITIHAGEAAGPENIWQAIEDLGAKRIGHGFRSIEDPELLKYLVKRNIHLEVCPTSNVLTQCVPCLKEHPIIALMHEGVSVSINTDDPGIFGISIPSEVEACQKELGLTVTELKRCSENARKASFLKK